VAAGNGLATGQTISAPGVASGTTISSMGNSSGGPGYYILSKSQTAQAGSPLALGTGLTGITSETMFNQNPNANGDAGIYVMLVDPASGSTPSISFYYLDTGYGPSQDPLQLNRPNGIAYAAPVDLDGDNTVDYVYAGDVFGNLWRFDLTSSSASNWTVSSFAGGSSTTPSPLFSAGSTGGTYPNLTDQPITTRPLIVTVPGPNGSSAVMVEFGTGQEIPFNPVSAVSYAGGTQALYGIWDWNMNAWNSLSHMSLASLGSSGLSGGTITPSSANLAQQQLTVICAISSCVSTPSNPNLETVTSNPVCWYGASACSSGNTQYGWELPFNATQSPGEQVIYNPGEWQGVLQVNTTIPAPSTIYSCTIDLPTGYTMFLNPATGGSLTTSAWLGSNGSPLTTGGGAVVTGEELGAVGTGTVITTSSGVSFDVNQLSGGGASANATKGVSTSAGHTVTWTQLR
jgi:type IV pilus assembly protein PilY1